MKLKIIISILHRWLGLISGLVVFLVAITGCIYAFQQEIRSITEDYRNVTPAPSAILPPSEIQKIATKIFPDKHLHAIMYHEIDQAAEAIFYDYDPYYYDIIFINPYNGTINKVKDMTADFFQVILQGHYYLWLPPDVGKPLVASSTLVFFILLISGLFLWWPRNKKSGKEKFKIKWNARWRRKNFDLHSVVGFYAFSIALILCITGLVFGFQWFADGWYSLIGGKKSLVYEEPFSNKQQINDPDQINIDQVWQKMNAEYPNASSIEIHIPATDSSSIAANANIDHNTYWKLDFRYFDAYTLAELPVNHIYGRKPEEFADKIIRMNYDIHIGAIAGLLGKIIMFIASLLCASLPVTGILLWWGRKYKRKK